MTNNGSFHFYEKIGQQIAMKLNPIECWGISKYNNLCIILVNDVIRELFELDIVDVDNESSLLMMMMMMMIKMFVVVDT